MRVSNLKEDFLEILITLLNDASFVAPQIPLWRGDAGIEPRTIATMELAALTTVPVCYFINWQSIFFLFSDGGYFPYETQNSFSSRTAGHNKNF